MPHLRWDVIAQGEAQSPQRIAILKHMAARQPPDGDPGWSAKTLAPVIDATLGDTSYHVRVLRDHQWISEVGRREARGAVQKFYELTDVVARDDCPMCGTTGWVLDSNDRSKPGPRMLELIECLLPDCPYSGRAVQNLSFKGTAFDHASMSPLDGRVMSVSVRGPGAP